MRGPASERVRGVRRGRSPPAWRALTERTAIWVGAVAGAIVGGVCGYLFLTENGRRLREDLGPRLTDVMNELGRAQSSLQRARAAVSETLPSERPIGTT